MLRRIVIFIGLCLFFVAGLKIINPGPAFPATEGKVWPKPQQQTKEDTYLKLTPCVFKFRVMGVTCDIIRAAVDRYTTVITRMHRISRRRSKRIKKKHAVRRSSKTDPNFKGTLGELQINLGTLCEVYPHLDMDEKYSLNVSTISKLKSNSVWGILRGMETFVQLFYMSRGYRHVLINTTQIVDFPRYKHRGLLIDTSRHYLTVSNILKTLDAMEMNKMNVLHWHIVDDQSFPYQSDVFPQLSEQGAYDPSLVYTKKNIITIVDYARDRGIRVLPEFDVPGHTSSWGIAYSGILTKCYAMGLIVGLGPMDPSNNTTYKLIGELIREAQDRFRDRYFHLGGDEVAMDCWVSNPELLEFMKEHNMKKPSELHAYFMSRVIPLLGNHSRPIVWQEVFDEGVKLPSDAIIQVWKTVGPKAMIPILAANHKVIYSASWYLDYLDNGGDWEKFYTDDPRQMIPRRYKNLNLTNILGGEACMWGESVDDANLISRVWPRASAVAEILWSAEQPRYENHSFIGDEVSRRLEEHTCRMNRRGVHAQPPNGPGFCVGTI